MIGYPERLEKEFSQSVAAIIEGNVSNRDAKSTVFSFNVPGGYGFEYCQTFHEDPEDYSINKTESFKIIDGRDAIVIEHDFFFIGRTLHRFATMRQNPENLFAIPCFGEGIRILGTTMMKDRRVARAVVSLAGNPIAHAGTIETVTQLSGEEKRLYTNRLSFVEKGKILHESRSS